MPIEAGAATFGVDSVTWEGWFTLIMLAVMLGGLTRFGHLADVIFLGGATLLGLVGIITPAEALAGFSNPGMLTIAALFVVAAGLRESGVLDSVADRLLPPPTQDRGALVRLVAPAMAMSAFLNNTTIVAMAMPTVLEWCRKHRAAASRFLIPLSYASICGGICTLIGTSTTLVVHGLLLEKGMPGLGFFEIGQVGLPVALASFAYLMLVGRRLLPDRPELLDRLEAVRREYMVEMAVEPTCTLIGKSVEQAGLRHLPGLFLVEIDRAGDLIYPVAPDERIESGDHLVFAGVISTIVDLQKIEGLTPVGAEGPDSALRPHPNRRMCEAVISGSSPVVGRGIRDANFRTVYDAAVIAVHRNGARLAGKVGDIVLRPGDTLLLQTGPGFLGAHRNNPDFYLVSEVGGVAAPRREKSKVAVGILAAMVLLMALPDCLGLFGAPASWTQHLDRLRVLVALAAGGGMVVSRALTGATARRAIEWQVLLVVAAAFAIARALEKTGAAAFLADGLMHLAKPVQSSTIGPFLMIAVVYFITNLLTELITNNAAAAVVFPVAVATAAELGVDARPFAVTVAVAASASFATPIGYQTNMMVFGPGGYRFGDFLRVGLPLNILWFLLATLLIPLIWEVKLP